MSMQNLQAEFAEAIMSNEVRSDLIRPAMNISIHQNNIFSSLLNTLKDIYPLITKLIGEDFFRVTAKEYINCYPSCSGNLHDYGEYFSDFLAEYQPLHDLIYLAEVAQFEWACHTVCFAAEHAPLSIEKLQQFNPDQYEQLHFTLHPASQLIKFHFPILRIIDLCNGDINEVIDVNEGGINLLIIRRDLNLSLIPLAAGEFEFLLALHNNATLSQAEKTAVIIQRDFQLDQKLPEWISKKIIVDCHLADN